MLPIINGQTLWQRLIGDNGGVTVESVPNALATVTATIANGQSLSGEADLGEGRVLVGIIMPAAWTAAVLTFQAGAATGVVANVYQFGGEVSYTVDASRYIALQDVMHFYGARYVHVRSGTAAAAVAQGAERVITLVTARR
jgi:alkyl hydroperoxide reductase subunit AhpF